LAGATLSAALRAWGTKRAMVALATIVGTTGVIEKLGSETGRPFGRYRYTGALQPSLTGVPALVPLAWFAMALPARETAHAALGRRSSPMARIVCGSLALTAWDLFLDPQMVAEGYWRWERPGSYRGIPAVNYAGWFLTGLGLMAALELAVPPRAAAGPEPLSGLYAWMGAMETLGFGVFSRDRTAAAAGGLGMLPIAAVALGRSWRARSAATRG
jgi:putative membrane protein